MLTDEPLSLENIKKVFKTTLSSRNERRQKRKGGYMVDENIIYRVEEGIEVEAKLIIRNRLYVPNVSREAITRKMYYDEVTLRHLGMVNALKDMRQRNFWPRIQQPFKK